jgi:hypothetical protein
VQIYGEQAWLLRDWRLMEHLWALSHKKGWPLPDEKMVLLRKAQIPNLFEARNLRLDGCELTLKSANLPALARQQLLFLAFHDSPHAQRCHRPLKLMLSNMLAVTAPRNLASCARDYAISGEIGLSGSRHIGKDSLTHVKLLQ